jgi:hypothetical protein
MSKTFKIRTPLAVVARARKAGVMHDRRQPRGGAYNEMRDYLDEIEDMQEEQVAIGNRK